MILHKCIFHLKEVHRMDPAEILEIIKAFFEAMRKILAAMGVMKDDTAA